MDRNWGPYTQEKKETQCLVVLLVSGAVLLVSAAELTLLVAATQYARVAAVAASGERV